MLAVERSSLFRTLGVCCWGVSLRLFWQWKDYFCVAYFEEVSRGGVHVMVVLTVEMWYLRSYL